MSKAGRKRKVGARHPNGQLVRTPKNDKGTPELQMHRLARIGAVTAASGELWLSKGAEAAIAGTMPRKKERKRGAPGGVPGVKAVDTTETIDPIGRAWAAGLLDYDPMGYDALALRDAGRRFSALYWRKLPSPSPVSGLYAKMVGGLVDELSPGVDREHLLEDADARDERQEQALNRILTGLRRLGHRVKKATDQLTLDPFADIGPDWLDQLIAAKAGAQPAIRVAISEHATNEIGALRVGNAMVPVIHVDGEAAAPIQPGDWWRFCPRIGPALAVLNDALSGLRLIHGGGRLILPVD